MLSSKAFEPSDWKVLMTVWQRYIKTLIVLASTVLAGCVSVDENAKKNPQLGLITTPPTYYTTQKARYLGDKYKNNLDRLVERIVRNPKTVNLQFANNIASVGGIGFFTHSATSSADERFLEVIMAVPETFDAKLEQSAKVDRIFSLYGSELLSILASDSDIYQEREVSGYGLNLSWRNLVPDSSGPRISLERAILYFPKARARGFLRGDLTQNALLGEAVIFAVVDDGPMKLASYRPQELKPDSRSPIQEESLASQVQGKPDSGPQRFASPALIAGTPIKGQEPKEGSSESVTLSKVKPAVPAAHPSLPETLEAPKEVASAVDKSAEAPVASTASRMESPKTKELLETQMNETVVRKQESVDRSKKLASLEQRATESENVDPNGDLSVLQVPPVLPPIASAPKVDRALQDQSNEPVLSGSKLDKAAPSEEAVTRPSPQVLQGFVIQLAFGEARDAQHWAATLERRGFAVSLTEEGGSAAVRVRIGNFTGREEAERQLQVLRQDGLKGIILNLPQAYRPEVPAPVSEESGKTASALQ
jgi:cell division protein FtsN